MLFFLIVFVVLTAAGLMAPEASQLEPPAVTGSQMPSSDRADEVILPYKPLNRERGAPF